MVAVPPHIRRQRERKMQSEGFTGIRVWVHKSDMKKAEKLRERGDQLFEKVKQDCPVEKK